MKVLIVEDEMLIAHATKIQLERDGNTVVGLAKTEERYWELMELSPDIILMDVKLKNNTSGVELARKTREAGHLIPIIFTTGNSKHHTEIETKNIVSSIIMNKPISYGDLRNAINSFNP